MRRIVGIILIAVLLMPAFAGCGSSPQPAVKRTGATVDSVILPLEAQRESEAAQVSAADSRIGEAISDPNTVQPEELFLVRPEGAKGSLIAYDLSTGRESFRLPAGLASTNGKHYYVATALPMSTLLQVFALPGGGLARDLLLHGRWSLSAVSHTGRWLALTRIPGRTEKEEWTRNGQWQTEIRIIDGTSGQLINELRLDGNFEVETISADGRALFLIQHLPAVNPDHYLIRLYDVQAGALQHNPLIDKRAPIDQVMAGLAWDGIASPDGRWLLTLYLSTRRNAAFIHALNLHHRFPVCIDLPSGDGDFTRLKHYTLALAPGGAMLYAANPALGIVAEVDMRSLTVKRTVTFEPASEAAGEYEAQAPASRSVISHDGRLLYFAGRSTIWVYDTKEDTVRDPIDAGVDVVGLGLSDDGSRLYVAGNSDRLQVFDAASGQALESPDRQRQAGGW